MSFSWSQVTGRRALSGAAVAALGTMLALAPAASALADTSAPQSLTAAAAQAPVAAQVPAAAQAVTAAQVPAAAQALAANEPELGMLGADPEYKSHWHGNRTIIICEYCQVAGGNIYNVEKVIIKGHHEDN
jgi:hypothetical protein